MSKRKAWLVVVRNGSLARRSGRAARLKAVSA